MRYQVRQFESMKLALKDLEQFIKNPALLRTGRPLKQFGDMLPREVLANWLLCATVNAVKGTSISLLKRSDRRRRDNSGGSDQRTLPTEHTMVSTFNQREGADAQILILEAIEKKRTKGGAAYASGKTLVVFLDLDGTVWFPSSVARALPNPLHFATVWAVCFLKRTDDGEYIYAVTHLDVSEGDAPTFLVRIAKDFDAWNVAGVQ